MRNFGHAWKNDVWHVYEPVSFDLVDGNSIVQKANRWVGRAVSLSDSPEPFQLHLLLGEPQDEKLPVERSREVDQDFANGRRV